MSDPRLWMAALAVGALLCFYFGFRNWRLARLIDDTPVSRIRSAAQGYVELSGTARCAEGQPNVAPLTRLPCAWWLYRIEHRTGTGKETRWQSISHAASVVPFSLEDESGSCLVGPVGADVRPSNKSSWRGSLPWPRPPGAGPRFLGLQADDYRYTEHRINERELVSVIGEFRTLCGAGATDVTAEVANLLAAWKQDQTGLLRRFDADHNGVLSQTEWEQARASARSCVLEQAAHTAAPAASIVVQPQDDRPFLIAACDPRKLAARSRLAAVFLLASFLVAVAALAAMMFGSA